MKNKIYALAAAAAMLTGCATVSSDKELIVAINTTGSYMKISDPSGDARLRYRSSSVHPCWQGSLPVKVDWTEKNLILQPTPNMGDCPTIRWLIRRDGSGGERQVNEGGKWARAEYSQVFKVVQQ